MEAPKSASFGAMGSLLRKLDALEDTEVNGARGLRDDLGSISTKLAKLSEIDDPSLTMNYWMNDVRELSYDMEDCVDQFIYSIGPDDTMAWRSNLLGFSSRLEEVRDRYNRYNLEYDLRHSTTTVRHHFRTLYRESTPILPVGMESPLNQLCWQIEPKSDDENNMQLKVISILGVEGVGKSTLAQNLWNELGGQFECKAFVQTAKRPDMRIILKNILSQILLQKRPEVCQLVPNLIHNIRKHLQDKRFFIIIDDLRSVSVWDVLSRCFPEGNRCSRIITTTTIHDVALASCSYDPEHIFQLKPLGDDYPNELFVSRVFGSGKGCPLQFTEVLADITKKCGGLPLAIRCIATLLASQPETIEHWEFVRRILNHNLRISSSSAEILEVVLKLCYSTLPHCLKTCLLYLSTYPENYVFLKDDLVRQWIAEDFICTMDGMDLEEVASRYFDELLSLGLIQRMDTNSKKKGLSYVVHPAVFDFIMRKSMEDNFITIIDYSQSTVVLTDKIRRLSLQFGSATYATQPTTIDVSQVRSLTFIGLLNCMPLLAEFKLVRILILHFRSDDGATRFSLADIGELLLLRYLQVRSNVVVELPHNIQRLKHLEILEINAKIEEIPSDIDHVRKLSNLCLGERKNFKHRTLNHVASGKAVSLDSSSELTPLLQVLEFLPPICISSRMPVWIYKLRRLYILEIVVRELRTEDISALGELPALTALSLYVRIPAEGSVVFSKGMFPVLEYLKFVSGVLLMDFQDEAMPNLRRLKLGFNAHKGEQFGGMLVGIQHLLNLQEIVASIGAATNAEEFDRKAAWSALSDAIRMHPCHKSFKIKRVDRIDEEYDPSKKQSSRPESVSEQDDVPKEPCVTQQEGLSTEQLQIIHVAYTGEHADISEMDENEREVGELECMFTNESAEPIQISYSVIKSITKNFCQVIGHGGFGVVYLGALRNDVMVAVKELRLSQDFSDTQFLEEIKCLKRVKHKNIVRFLGYCAHTDGVVLRVAGEDWLADVPKRFLCFEYAPNGNLHDYLQEITSCGHEWSIHYKILRGICQGLHYLHQQRITHLDLKPENVLLGAKMVPKITDFGFSRCNDGTKFTIFTKHLQGTPGYIPPELIDKGKISFKSDIYSLGIIMIRLLTGNSKDIPENWHVSLNADCQQMKTCIEIARDCADKDASRRPTISDVICKLIETESTVQSIPPVDITEPVNYPNSTLHKASSPLQVKYADGELERLEHKLFIGMLPKNVTDTELTDLFSKYGNIKDLQILRGSQQTSKAGCAFLKYETKEQALEAIEALNGKHKIEGSSVPLYVKWADTEKERQDRKAQRARLQLSNMPNAGPMQESSLFGGLQMGYMTQYNRFGYQPLGTYGVVQYPLSPVQNQATFPNMVQPVNQGNSLRGVNPELSPGSLHRSFNAMQLGSPYPAVPGMQYPGSYPGAVMNNRPFGNSYNSMKISSANANSTIDSSPSNNVGGQIEGPAGANLFIYHIPQDFGDQELSSAFQSFGRVVSAKVFVDKATGVSKCFGFVSYDTPASAQAAISMMNGFQLGGKKLKVQLKRENNKHSKPY